MKDNELNKCNCSNDECGCDCDCHEEHESFVVDLEDDNGNITTCEVVDAFEYKDKEYVLVQDPNNSSVYLFESRGEEGELSIPEEDEFEEVTKYYQEELANI